MLLDSPLLVSHREYGQTGTWQVWLQPSSEHGRVWTAGSVPWIQAMQRDDVLLSLLPVCQPARPKLLLLLLLLQGHLLSSLLPQVHTGWLHSKKAAPNLSATHTGGSTHTLSLVIRPREECSFLIISGGWWKHGTRTENPLQFLFFFFYTVKMDPHCAYEWVSLLLALS